MTHGIDQLRVIRMMVLAVFDILVEILNSLVAIELL